MKGTRSYPKTGGIPPTGISLFRSMEVSSIILVVFLAVFDAGEAVAISIGGGIGLTWERLEGYGEHVALDIHFPRSHPEPGYGSTLWSYGAVQVQDCRSAAIYQDEVQNLLVRMSGPFESLTYYIVELVETDTDPLRYDIDETERYPYPDEYPPEVEEFLMPGRNIESDDSDIQALALELAGDEADPVSGCMYRAVMAIIESEYFASMPYDYDHLDEIGTGCVTTSWADERVRCAREVYDDYLGVCASKSRLAAALCRSIAIPARTVSKVGLHTWNEVWINGVGWVPAEVTGNPQFPKVIKGPSHTTARISGRDDYVWFTWEPQYLSEFRKLPSPVPTPELVLQSSLMINPAAGTLHDCTECRQAFIPIGSNVGMYIVENDPDHELYAVNLSTGVVLETRPLHGKGGTVKVSIPGENIELLYQYSKIDNFICLARPLQRSR